MKILNLQWSGRPNLLRCLRASATLLVLIVGYPSASNRLSAAQDPLLEPNPTSILAKKADQKIQQTASERILETVPNKSPVPPKNAESAVLRLLPAIETDAIGEPVAVEGVKLVTFVSNRSELGLTHLQCNRNDSCFPVVI